jgi:hypothetical protein
MKTYTEQRLIEMAKTSPAWQQHISDEFFKRFRTPDGIYNEQHKRQLAEWLVRFSHVQAPIKEKEVTQ